MDKFKEDIQEIKEDVKSLVLSNRLQELTLVKVELDLKYHIKRTDALEQMVSEQKREFSAQLAEQHLEFKKTHDFVVKCKAVTGTVLRIVSGLGVLAGLILKAMGVF